MSARVVLYHKQATSARLRFLCWPGPTVCAFDGLPPLAQVCDGPSEAVVPHPGALLARVEKSLGLGPGALELEPGFSAHVDVPGEPLTVFLARFRTIDPPFDGADRVGGRFVELTGARSLLPAELELLREVYCRVMD